MPPTSLSIPLPLSPPSPTYVPPSLLSCRTTLYLMATCERALCQGLTVTMSVHCPPAGRTPSLQFSSTPAGVRYVRTSR